MKIQVTNYIELIHAIHNANMHPHEPAIIDLIGKDDEFILHDYTEVYYGKTAFPIVTSDVTINGNGITLTRSEDAVPFRFFALNNQVGWQRNASVRLTLNDLTLLNGKSWVDGGGALMNNGEVLLNNCTFQNNVGTLGGAIYNGDAHPLALKGCVFNGNVGLLEGGAVYNANLAQVRLDDCVFSNNRVVKGQQADIYIFNTVNPVRFMGDGKPTATVAMNGSPLDDNDVQTLNRFAQIPPPTVTLPPVSHNRINETIYQDSEDKM